MFIGNEFETCLFFLYQALRDYFMNAKTVSAIWAKNLRETCKVHCIYFTKQSTKKDFLRSLGQILYEKGVVRRKDETDNLISCTDEEHEAHS